MSEQTPASLFGKDPTIIVRSHEPFNAGAQLSELGSSFITPTEHFFVRSHGDVPDVDPITFRLVVAGMVQTPLSMSLHDLSQLPRHAITATLQCAGNRRQDLIDYAPIPGELPWDADAISTATWSGVRLRDVLALAGVNDDVEHVAFEGLDQTERKGKRFCFGGSIPLAKAMHPDTLLADTMNDAPLLPVHGAPLRVVAPGYIGARSVKWLNRITLQREPSDNYFQAVAYRLFAPDVNHDTVEWETGMMLGELSLNAVICSPPEGAQLATGMTTIRGYAMVGGERSVARVDVSIDGGATWYNADLISAAHAWSWRLWQIELDLPTGEHELVVRIVDSAANMQPEHVENVWNFKGYMNNAWHRVNVEVR